MPHERPKTLEEQVDFRVFKQTRTEGTVTTYEVVDRIADPTPSGSRIVGIYQTAEEADAHRDRLRKEHLAKLARR